MGCEPTNTSNPEFEKVEFVLYPNPASTHIVLGCHYPLPKAAEWSLSDALGRVVKRRLLAPGAMPNTMWIENLPGGFYFWNVRSEGSVIGTGKVMVIKE